MIVHDHVSSKSSLVDFRETAPANIDQASFDGATVENGNKMVGAFFI